MSLFTKNHYEALAKVFFNDVDCSIIKSLCEMFEEDNPQFDVDKFKVACGYDYRYDQEPDWDAIDAYVDGTGPHPWGVVQIIKF